MFSRVILPVLLLAGAAGNAFAADGRWNSEPSDEDQSYIQVEIAPCETNAALKCGLITGYFKDGAESESDTVGKWIIKDMKANGEGAWKGGTIWAPDEDKTYKAKMALLDENTLEVSGCIFVFCRGQEWTRATEQ